MKKILSAILAGIFTLGSFSISETEAASREEVAAINVKNSADFKFWNEDSPTLKKITNFVEDAINPNSKNFIPEEDRIANFDMDGTFYCETAPLYFQETMFFYRALEDKNYQPSKEMVAFAKKIRPKIYDKTGITAKENAQLFKYLTKAYEGMTPEEYRAYVRNFMQTNETGLTNLKRGEAFYLPMIEVMSYLTNNGFAVYINTACGIDTTRELVGDILPIRSDRIIASDFVYTTTKIGKDEASKHFFDRKTEKIIISGKPIDENGQTVKAFSILNHIGKKPVLSFGNSMGDSGMFEFTLQDNKYHSEVFCLLCDDTERELGNISKADKMKDIATKRGWNTVSMRDEFKTIYGDNVKVEK